MATGQVAAATAQQPDPFNEASAFANETQDFVLNQLERQIDEARSLRDEANNSISEMANFELGSVTGNVPTAPGLSALDVNVQMPTFNPVSFGQVDSVTLSVPNAPTVDIPSIDVAPFVPSITSLNIPEAPLYTAPGQAPDAPAEPSIALPDAPVLERPLFPSLSPITIPTFDFPVLPTFDATAPEFEGTSVSTVMQWTESPHQIVVLDEMVAKLRQMWAGGTGLPAAVEQALFERAASREDLVIARDVSAAMTEFADRGFTMPQGMLVARVDAIREEGAIKKNALSREVYIKAIDTEIQNLRFACEQAIAAENVYVSIWNSIAQRQFEVAKIELDAQLALYNAQVAVFNARQSAYATEATVFKTRLDAELTRIEVFKAELEGELAKGQLNQQQVQIYSEQVKALLTDVEIYKAQMEGASVQADVYRSRIEGYKARVGAYAETIQAEKVKFDAYKSRVEGETAKASMLEAESRAYAAYVSGQSSVASIGVERARAQIESARLNFDGFRAQVEQERTRVTAQSEAIRANAAAFTAGTSQFSAQAQAQASLAQANIAAYEAQNRTALALYETETRRYIADMEQLIRKASLQLEAIKAAGQASATLAAGAMAGVNVGASVSGSGSVGASGTISDSFSRSYTYGKSKSYGVGISAESPTVPADTQGDWV